MLIENVLHVDKAEAEIWTTAMEQLVKVEKGVAGSEGGHLSRSILFTPFQVKVGRAPIHVSVIHVMPFSNYQGWSRTWTAP